MNIIIASHNPVKIQASLRAFQAVFPDQEWQITSVSVPSGVSDQPMTEQETRQGATNRALHAHRAHPEGDFWVGIEGGIAEEDSNMHAFAWMAVFHQNHLGEARTATFFLPPPVTQLIREGDELGVADDKVFGVSNSKQQNGAIGLLSGNVIDRESLYIPAVVMALIPFKNPKLYGLTD